MTKIYIVIFNLTHTIKAYTSKKSAEAEIEKINRSLYMAGHDSSEYAYLKEVELVTE